MPPQLSMDALNALYRDVGEARHTVYERNVQIVALRQEVAALRDEVAALRAKYEPAGEPTRLRKEG